MPLWRIRSLEARVFNTCTLLLQTVEEHSALCKATASHSSVLQKIRRWRGGGEGSLLPWDLLVANRRDTPNLHTGTHRTTLERNLGRCRRALSRSFQLRPPSGLLTRGFPCPDTLSGTSRPPPPLSPSTRGGWASARPLRQTGPGARSRQPLRLPGPHRHSDRPPPPSPPGPAPAALRILSQPQLVALERRLRALRSLHGCTREPEEKQDPGLRRASPPPLPRRQPPRPGGHDGNRRCRQLTRRPRGGAGPAAGGGRPACREGRGGDPARCSWAAEGAGLGFWGGLGGGGLTSANMAPEAATGQR